MTRPAAALATGSILLGMALLAGTPALAGDVSVRLDSGAGFSIRNNNGLAERLRVDEATGNVSRNGALFVHTTGTNNTFVGANAGNPGTYGNGNSAFGFSAFRYNTTGFRNSAFGGSALRLNTTGARNSAFGSYALRSNTTGYSNSALGFYALRDNDTGFRNSAFGTQALRFNGTGHDNSAFGHYALHLNTTASGNAAFGAYALSTNSGSFNVALGFGALSSTTGGHNTAVGYNAGALQTSGSNNIYLANIGLAGENGSIRIGTTSPVTQVRAFVAGIRGVTTANADAIPVLIDSAGQLGTVSSSRDAKKEIRDMGDATARLLELRPVTFRYEQEQTLPNGGELPPEYGLVAEEVAEVFPDLVVYDLSGRPFTVKYHVMAPMLLNEMQKQQRTIAKLEARIAELEARPRAEVQR